MNKQQLEQLSDLDINFRVAKFAGELLDIPKWCEPLVVGDKMCYYDEFRNICDRHADYCNNWSDMGPLIQDSSISLNPVFYGEWCARLALLDSTNKNPLRAAAIVYLLMQEGV